MKKISSLVAVSVSLLISACGGGGASNSSPTSTVPPVTTPVVVPPTVTPAKLQTVVPAPVYSNTQNIEVFNAVNDFRKSQGLGLLKQSVNLDAAVEAHNKYGDLNQYYGHTEDSGKPGFTGITPTDRALFANYGAFTVGEFGTTLGYLNRQKGAQELFYTLINSVYHRAGLMTQTATDIGISVLEKQNTAGNGQTYYNSTLYINYGLKTTQNNASDFMTVYPRDNQTDVILYMNPEAPNPVPELPATIEAMSKGTSSPISLMISESLNLKVESYKVINASTGQEFPVRLLTNDSDKLILPSMMFLIGKQPFSPNTKYLVEFTGTSNGVRFIKNWSFTTGTKTLLDVF